MTLGAFSPQPAGPHPPCSGSGSLRCQDAGGQVCQRGGWMKSAPPCHSSGVLKPNVDWGAVPLMGGEGQTLGSQKMGPALSPRCVGRLAWPQAPVWRREKRGQ